MSSQPLAVIDLSFELSNGYAARFIRYKVMRLVGRAGIRPSDCEDLEQEIKLHLIKRFEKFDPRLAHWNTFVVAVVSRYILTLIVKRRRSHRREAMEFLSLDGLVNDDEEKLDHPGVDGANGHTAHLALDTTEQLDVAIDVHETIDRLPHRSRELCERLMNDSTSEGARQLHLPRTTLCGRISALRQQFEPDFENCEKILFVTLSANAVDQKIGGLRQEVWKGRKMDKTEI